jgi:FkbM family methyltransferase
MKSDYKGFYVDIGAFHPEIISNTQWFYEHGWRGINIDANPHSIILFNKKRKRDINILSGVSDKDGEMNYYYYWNETASRNTFDEELYKKWSDGGMKLKEIKKIKVKTINEILDKYLLEGQRIDFVTIDVEGFEMKILSTYNFKKYAPTYFLIEDLVYEDEDIDFMTFSGRPLYKFMKGKGYSVIGKTRYTILFKKDGNQIESEQDPARVHVGG